MIADGIQVPIWLSLICELNPSDRLIYGTLIWAGGRKKSVYGRPLTLLAAVAGVSERTASRSLETLERCGLLRIDPPRTGEAYRRYTLLRHEAMYVREQDIDMFIDSGYLTPDDHDGVGYRQTYETIDRYLAALLQRHHIKEENH